MAFQHVVAKGPQTASGIWALIIHHNISQEAQIDS